MNAAASKTQIRVLNALKIEAVDSYEGCAALLAARGLDRGGLPTGWTWRTAAKATDSDLLAALGASAADIAESREGCELYNEVYR